MGSLANAVAALHLAYFVFVAGGFVGILVAMRRGWTWIYDPWFRITHLFAVLIVPAEDVFHFPCVLNVLEAHLRATSTNAASATSQVSVVLDLLLRHTIPGWLLDDIYWTLSVLLIALIVLLPPRFSRSAGRFA